MFYVEEYILLSSKKELRKMMMMMWFEYKRGDGGGGATALCALRLAPTSALPIVANAAAFAFANCRGTRSTACTSKQVKSVK